jgi:hypothetical protein
MDAWHQLIVGRNVTYDFDLTIPVQDNSYSALLARPFVFLSALIPFYFFLFLRVASCCVYYYNFFGAPSIATVFFECFFYYQLTLYRLR